jgi:uncharacterized membrane protein YhaH (DUF805 family)
MSNRNKPVHDPTTGNSRGNVFEDNTRESMGMMDYVKTCFKKYADFSGRARRSEYWYFYLFNIIVSFALYIPAIALMVAESELFWLPVGLLIIYGLAIILPSLAAVVRRLHDTGRSGWYYLMAFIPFVGGIILIVFLVQDSVVGTNEWGPNPKRKDADLEDGAFG